MRAVFCVPGTSNWKPPWAGCAVPTPTLGLRTRLLHVHCLWLPRSYISDSAYSQFCRCLQYQHPCIQSNGSRWIHIERSTRQTGSGTRGMQEQHFAIGCWEHENPGSFNAGALILAKSTETAKVSQNHDRDFLTQMQIDV